MSIEKTLERIADLLEEFVVNQRTAVSIIEDAAASMPVHAEVPAEPPEKVEPEVESPKPKSATKKAKPVKKEEPVKAPEAPEVKDVKSALVKLQKLSKSPKLSIGILKDVGGTTTIGKLDPEKYQDIIDAAVEAGNEL